jgi:hypothetical protein
VRQLDDVLALLVLLARLERLLVLPSERRLAAVTVDVGDSVQPGEEDAFLGRAASDVHHRVEEVGATLAALERLGDELIVIGKMRAAVHAAVLAVARGQVGTERLDGLGHRRLGVRPRARRRRSCHADATPAVVVASPGHDIFPVWLVVYCDAVVVVVPVVGHAVTSRPVSVPVPVEKEAAPDEVARHPKNIGREVARSKTI